MIIENWLLKIDILNNIIGIYIWLKENLECLIKIWNNIINVFFFIIFGNLMKKVMG